jgi:poly-gamma-glutamate capsule biosynthesis protein CapA/YwtB (metallophosphatase superfamily)
MKIMTLFLCILIFQNVRAAEQDTFRLKMVFAGDIMGHGSQIQGAYIPDTDSYNYDTCFYFLKDILYKADLSLANLEVTLAGKPYTGYPAFSSPDELADAIKNAGFNTLVTANNHSVDRSQSGLERTIQVLEDRGIIRTGTFINDSLRSLEYPLIIEKNNIRLAILNYTYGTNGIAVKFPNIVNMTDTVQIKTDLEKALIAEPDFVIAAMHWGNEYERFESKEQQRLADFLIRNGADAVIGSHPHVVQPIREFYSNSVDSSNMKLVVYSLGNLISNQRQKHTDGGILLEIDIEKTDRTRISSYTHIPVWVYKQVNNDRANFILLPGEDSAFFQDYYQMNKADRDAYDLFLEETDALLNKKQ